MTWREWTLDCPDGWSHHNVEVLPDGTIVGYHPRDPELLFFDLDGTLLRTTACEAREAHDIALADDGGLWIADGYGSNPCRSHRSRRRGARDDRRVRLPARDHHRHPSRRAAAARG